MAGNVEQVIEPRIRDLGGFEVRRVLPAGARRRSVGPFVFFDEMGPADFAPGEGIDVRPHPHIGLATVTYLFEGEIVHRDSLGVVQPIRPGDVNWMTAGRGIVHSERSGETERAAASRLHGIQSWIALPRRHEEAEPAFRHHRADSLPRIERDGADVTVVAGDALGERSPVQALSPILYLDVRLQAGARLRLPAGHPERAAYAVSGSLSVDGEALAPRAMTLFAAGAAPELAAAEDSRLVIIGGAPPDGERIVWWNFVSSSPERIERAKQDWREQRFESVPGDDERIPLPEA